jgi:hypothetical protein
MNNQKGAERLISQRWPKLKKRAQNENNPEKLIAILEEIDDLLSNLEMRIASQNRSMRSGTDTIPESASFAFDLPSGDSESGSQ